MATGKWRMEIWHNETGNKKNVTIPITVTYGGKTVNVNVNSQKQIINTGFESTLGSRLNKNSCNVSGSYSIVNGIAYSGLVTTQFDEFQSGKVDEDDYAMTSYMASDYSLMHIFYYGTIFDMSYFNPDNGVIVANTEKEYGLSSKGWFDKSSNLERNRINSLEVGCARSFYVDTSAGRMVIWLPSGTTENNDKIDGITVKILDENKLDITSKFDNYTIRKWENAIGWKLVDIGNVYIQKESASLSPGRYRILTEEFSGLTFYQNEYKYYSRVVDRQAFVYTRFVQQSDGYWKAYVICCPVISSEAPDATFYLQKSNEVICDNIYTVPYTATCVDTGIKTNDGYAPTVTTFVKPKSWSAGGKTYEYSYAGTIVEIPGADYLIKIKIDGNYTSYEAYNSEDPGCYLEPVNASSYPDMVHGGDMKFYYGILADDVEIVQGETKEIHTDGDYTDIVLSSNDNYNEPQSAFGLKDCKLAYCAKFRIRKSGRIVIMLSSNARISVVNSSGTDISSKFERVWLYYKDSSTGQDREAASYIQKEGTTLGPGVYGMYFTTIY